MNKPKQKKPWRSGPFKSIYNDCAPIHYQPDIEKPVKIFPRVIPKPNNIIINRIPEPIKQKPWRQASVASHELFILETKRLTII
jgi:hypothetical protein